MNKEEFINKGSEIEKELLTIFRKDEKIVIADIGACDGLSSIIYAKLFPNAFIYAFEMIQNNCEAMSANFKEYGIDGRTHIFNRALADKRGKHTYYRSSGAVSDWPYSSSLLAPKKHLQEHKWCVFSDGEIQVCRIDDLPINQIDFAIDFAHMDVQGAEMMVLRGGKRAFEKTRAFWVEVANIELYKNQPLKHDITKWFFGRGFKCLKDTCVNKKYGDMLFVRDK